MIMFQQFVILSMETRFSFLFLFLVFEDTFLNSQTFSDSTRPCCRVRLKKSVIAYSFININRVFFTSFQRTKARICNSETSRVFLAVLSASWLSGKAIEMGSRIIQQQSDLNVSRTGRQRIPSLKAPPRLLLSCGLRPVVKAASDLTISRDLISTNIGQAYNKANCFVLSIKISSIPALRAFFARQDFNLVFPR